MTHRIIVVGGGISGLAAAHRLIELGRERGLAVQVTLLEAGERLGGSILTEQRDGFLLEAGPDSFITEKPWALRLCDRLGLTSRLISTNLGQRNVYVVHKGSLQPLPEGFILLAPTRLWPLIRTPLFSWRGKLRMATEPFRMRQNVDGDESLASFVSRRFGREVLERVAQPLIGGIYAADPEKLSLGATMPRFLTMEQSRKSVILALWSEQRRSRARRSESGARWSLFVAPRGGMQELVDAVSSRLPEGVARLRAKTTEMSWDGAGKAWLVTTSQGKFVADGVILALPSYHSASLLSPFASELARDLEAIPYCSTATVNVAYREDQIPRSLNGFGFVVPAIEGRKIIACSFSSVKYTGRAPIGYVLLRAFVGGALQPELFKRDDRAMEDSVREELSSLLGVKAAPLFCRIQRHPRSLPQYQVGHLELVQRVEQCLRKHPSLALAGNAYRGVGISDCIHSGEEAAERLLERLTIK